MASKRTDITVEGNGQLVFGTDWTCKVHYILYWSVDANQHLSAHGTVRVEDDIPNRDVAIRRINPGDKHFLLLENPFQDGRTAIPIRVLRPVGVPVEGSFMIDEV